MISNKILKKHNLNCYRNYRLVILLLLFIVNIIIFILILELNDPILF